jgi:acetylornithine/N-succinyldiaminopimelate aminotransferase
MSTVFMNTYHRLPVTFAKGDGAWLTDINGKKYLDFSSGIAVNCLGHNYQPLVQAISGQAAKYNHVCNYFSSDVSEAFAEKLIAACSGAAMKKVFLCNSGAEANEGACKIARKYSLLKYGPGRHKIVTLCGSFHGRTITTLSATGQDTLHKDFGPFTEGFVHVPAGDMDALERALDPKTTAGLLIEPVQGESGIRPPDGEYVRSAAKLCAGRDILLMFDEIQTGVGRTGTFLACEAYGLQSLGLNPDIVTLAKSLCGGIPGAAVLAGEKAMDVFQIGDHGSTFGANPLAAAAGLVVLDTVNRSGFLKDISRKGEKFVSIIKGWKDPRVKEIRGRGLMLGIDISGEAPDDASGKAWQVLEKAVSAVNPGLLLLTAGKNTIRLLPPYIIKDEEIEMGLEILKGCLIL